MKVFIGDTDVTLFAYIILFTWIVSNYSNFLEGATLLAQDINSLMNWIVR